MLETVAQPGPVKAPALETPPAGPIAAAATVPTTTNTPTRNLRAFIATLHRFTMTPPYEGRSHPASGIPLPHPVK
jgi:hypothetical protein